MLLSICPFLSNAEQIEIDFFLDKNPEFYDFKNFVEDLRDFDKIICGRKHCYGTRSGSLYTAGYNDKGQLGLGSEDRKMHTWTEIKGVKDVKQVEAFSDYGILTTNSSKIFAVGNARSGMIGLPERKNYLHFTEVVIDGLSSMDIEIIMSERTTFIKDNSKNKYFATGSGYDKKGSFAMFDKSTRMGFIEIDLESVNDKTTFPKKIKKK